MVGVVVVETERIRHALTLQALDSICIRLIVACGKMCKQPRTESEVTIFPEMFFRGDAVTINLAILQIDLIQESR